MGRRFFVAETASFNDLHQAIQAAMGLSGDHLYDFCDSSGKRVLPGLAIDDQIFDADLQKPSEFKLAYYFTEKGTKCRYLYGLVNGWDHILEFLGATELSDKFSHQLPQGAQASPPENRDGVYLPEKHRPMRGLTKSAQATALSIVD